MPFFKSTSARPTARGPQLPAWAQGLKWTCVFCILLSTTVLLAQPPEGGGRGGRGPGGGPGFGGGFGGGGFGGFGGFGGRGGGVAGLLRRDSVKTELKITAEQEEQIREAATATTFDFRAFGERMRNAADDAERMKIGEEMRLEGEKSRKETEAKIKAVLKPEQVVRLEQLVLQDAGISAVREADVASSLKLTADQQKQLQTLQETYEQKLREGGFTMSREEREELRTERDTGMQNVLTADQKKAWEDKLGPPGNLESDNDRGGRRGGPRFGNSAGRPGTIRDEAPPMGAAVVVDLSGGAGGDKAEADKAASSTTPATGADGTTVTDGATEASGDKLMSFNFRYAPWELVLKHFAEHAGLTLDLNVVPPGTFNYFDDNKFTVPQALDVLNGYLSQKGYLLVRRDKFLVVVATDNIPPNLIPQITLEEIDQRGQFELVSVLLPVEGMDTQAAADEAQELLGPQGKIVPLSKSGRLLVTDLVVNIERIHELLNGLGALTPNDTATFQAYAIKHVSVIEAEKVVRDLFGLPQRSAQTGVAPAAPPAAQQQPQWGGRNFGQFGGFPNFGGRGGRGGFGGNDGGNNRRQQPQGPQPPQAAQAPVASNARIQVATDLRTNSLMVTAVPKDHKIIEAALKTLDIDERTNSIARNLTGRNSPQLEVYPITTADPLVVIHTITSMIPSAIVNEDTKAKRLHVFATADEQSQIKALIEQIDGGLEGGETSLVVTLRRLDPLGAAGSLRSLYKANRDDAPMIEADTIGRRLLIRGTTSQVNELRTILKQMGEDPDGTAAEMPGARGPVRTLSLGGRDPQEFVDLIQQIWPGRDSNPIRIVVPSAIAPTLKSGTLEKKTTEEKATTRSETINVRNQSAQVIRTRVPGSELDAATLRSLETLLDPKSVDQELEEAFSADNETDDETDDASGDQVSEDGSTPAETSASTADPATSQTPPVTGASDADDTRLDEEDKPVVMAPSGNNLIIASDDLEALDRLQAMIEALTLAAPKRTTWTVFYLRTADATETATMLGHLFPSGSVSRGPDSSASMMGSLTGSISSFGSSLMDMTGLSNLGASNALRIVPEVRSNALYVSGPTDLVSQVEDVLKVLDATELPESMRDRVPRMIPVEYADVAEVASIIENVYKDYMTAPAAVPNGGGGGGFNPLAMLMAAGGGNDPKQKRGIRLTVGVDSRTNSIIVSADEALYRQVESLVKDLDQAALDAKRTVKVVTVNSANSVVVQQALGSLLGRVKVSTTTGSGTPPGAPQMQAPGGDQSWRNRGGNRGGSSNFEQQLRQRFMQGAGMSPPGGGNNGGNRGAANRGGRGGRGGGFGGGNTGGGRGGR